MIGMAVNKVIFGHTVLVDLTEDTVTADKLLNGVTAHGSSGAQVHGTMANNGAVAASIDGLTVTEYTIPKGYHNGSGKVSFGGTVETWTLKMDDGSTVTKQVVVS